MRIGFSGTQSGMTNFQKATVKEILLVEKCDHFVHGDCVGADYEANYEAYKIGIKFFTIFPPDNPRKRAWCYNGHKSQSVERWEWQDYDYVKVRWAPRAPYLQRNQLIVDNCDMMIACPKEPEHTVRSGTWATIRYSWKVKRKIVIVPPIRRDE